MKDRTTYLSYVRELVEYVRSLSSLRHGQASVYAIRSFARGNLRYGSSDIDLVVACASEDHLSTIVEEVYALSRHHGASLISIPKIATPRQWLRFLALNPVEFGLPTMRECKLLAGPELLENSEAALRGIADDLDGQLVVQLVRTLMSMTRILGPMPFYRDRFGDLIVSFKKKSAKVAVRFFRVAILKRLGVYVLLDDDVIRLSKELFSPSVGELLRGTITFPESWHVVQQVFESLVAPVEKATPVPDRVTLQNWRKKGFSRFTNRVALVVADRPGVGERQCAAEFLRRDYSTALVCRSLYGHVINRVFPQSRDASDRYIRLEARRVLAYAAFNWRNKLIDHRIKPPRGARAGEDLAAVLDAFLTLDKGVVSTSPLEAARRFSEAYPAWASSEHVADECVIPLLAGEKVTPRKSDLHSFYSEMDVRLEALASATGAPD